MKKYLFSLLVGLLLLSFNNSFAQKVGYIKMEEIIKKSKIGQEYRRKIEPKLNKAKMEVKKIENKLKKLQKELSSSLLSEKVKRQKEIEFQRLLQQRQMIIAKYQQERDKAEINLVRNISKALKEYGNKNNFDVILTGGFINGVLYVGEKIDITQDFLKFLNKKTK